MYSNKSLKKVVRSSLFLAAFSNCANLSETNFSPSSFSLGVSSFFNGIALDTVEMKIKLLTEAGNAVNTLTNNQAQAEKECSCELHYEMR